jgi:hypothetical protein
MNLRPIQPSTTCSTGPSNWCQPAAETLPGGRGQPAAAVLTRLAIHPVERDLLPVQIQRATMPIQTSSSTCRTANTTTVMPHSERVDDMSHSAAN